MHFKSIIILALLVSAQHMFAQGIDEKKLRKHVTYLASDKLKGRGTGTPEEKMAGIYKS